MNKKSNFLKILFVAILVTISSSNLVAQEAKSIEMSKFSVSVEKTGDNEMKLRCTEGCAWNTLSFNLSDMKRIQAIDEFGMIDKYNQNKKDNNLSDFLITIQRTENGLSLKGLNGTAWTDLSFPLKTNLPQEINEMGMTK